MITLIHAGLSQAESETLFKMFEDFNVNEVQEDLTDEYVSKIHLEIPIAYNTQIFKNLGLDRWEDLKIILKNIKWRRGNKKFKLTLCFKGNPDVEFSLLTDSDRILNKALDTIEYQVDNVILQLKYVQIDNIKSITYRFNTDIYRWVIDNIIDEKMQVYRYINNRWSKI
ncbi:MAG: hypothetical protein KatS3mg003_2223 [Candidatus Nitrosocaldaceae archaeon]|nr:MAG: hypothetical protein KatS3mg003_2175 [Candidatus Nitrosocaldaceae archaeon]GIU72744.1 MAG: hypothetical protein KatS3mg003_2223 [Candidatus Nitrosocaldaceae archaeon]